MKTLQKTALIISAITTVPAMAQGVYLGSAIGTSTQENEFVRTDTHGGYLKVGYRLNDFIAAEYRFGVVDKNTSDLDLSSYNSLYLRGSYPLDENFELYGMVGQTISKIGGDTVSGDDSTLNVTSPSFGIGARYSATDNIGISAEYNAISTKRDYDLSGVFLSVDYQF
ncbi:porin family protein [Vibrio sp. ZSDZ34]|uniref:Porin family protein n=1 Tax=Vibrio gelatinilyticus TaxID=2893468 RepID=A0A9X1W9I7_9VIBR|nr:porin family protein [Vibrio gelatinilyticus]MCJ2376488.1 porin family protein [Vibrio gelatinilyticus]